MEVRNCKNCDRLFNYMGGKPICQLCKESLEDKFKEVKDYINSHPKVSVQQAAEDNDVSVKQIKQWIREERLILSEPSPDGITCEHCGQPICSGRFCEKCKASMANTLGSAIDKPKGFTVEDPKQQKDKNKMRFLQ